MTPSLPWKCSTTELRRQKEFRVASSEFRMANHSKPGNRNSKLRRAGDETRTRDPQLGRLMLYQLSYSREGVQSYEFRVSNDKLLETRNSQLETPLWAGKDSNLRTRTRPDLQSGAFNRSATCPKSHPYILQTPVVCQSKREFQVKSWRRDSNPRPAHYK